MRASRLLSLSSMRTGVIAAVLFGRDPDLATTMPSSPEESKSRVERYSARSASAGSVVAALRAGHQIAASPAPAKATTAVASVSGSRAVTPNS